MRPIFIHAAIGLKLIRQYSTVAGMGSVLLLALQRVNARTHSPLTTDHSQSSFTIDHSPLTIHH
jgi:hypothetical protein